jgi:hypothetical protein
MLSSVFVKIGQRRFAGSARLLCCFPPSFTLIVRYRQTGFEVFVDGFKVEIP